MFSRRGLALLLARDGWGYFETLNFELLNEGGMRLADRAQGGQRSI